MLLLVPPLASLSPLIAAGCVEIQALEPSISKQIMTLHHDKHHATYVNGLNTAEENLQKAQAQDDVKAQINLQPALKFNGGGHM